MRVWRLHNSSDQSLHSQNLVLLAIRSLTGRPPSIAGFPNHGLCVVQRQTMQVDRVFVVNTSVTEQVLIQQTCWSGQTHFSLASGDSPSLTHKRLCRSLRPYSSLAVQDSTFFRPIVRCTSLCSSTSIVMTHRAPDRVLPPSSIILLVRYTVPVRVSLFPSEKRV